MGRPFDPWGPKATAKPKYMTVALFSNDLSVAVSPRYLTDWNVRDVAYWLRRIALLSAEETLRLHDPVPGMRRVGWLGLEAPDDQFQERFNTHAAVEKLNHLLQSESGAFARGRQLANRSYE